jgi:hypothetical protein
MGRGHSDRWEKWVNLNCTIFPARKSRLLLDLVSSRSRPSLWALIEIDSRLLDRFERSGYDVLARRIRLPAREKAAIVLRALLRLWDRPSSLVVCWASAWRQSPKNRLPAWRTLQRR